MRTPRLMSLLVWMTLLLPQLSQGAAPLRISVLGDSLAAGYGLAPEQALPARLEQALRTAGLAVTVTNAGVSGDTTAGGLARLEWTLAEEPDLVIVELGANDALRGLDPAAVRANLEALLGRLRRAGVAVVLVGMRAPRNLGAEYTSAFDAIYPELAKKFRVPLYPFLLAGVAGRPELNQGDGLHPNRAGVAVMVEGLLPLVRQEVERLAGSPGH